MPVIIALITLMVAGVLLASSITGFSQELRIYLWDFKSPGIEDLGPNPEACLRSLSRPNAALMEATAWFVRDYKRLPLTLAELEREGYLAPKGQALAWGFPGCGEALEDSAVISSGYLILKTPISWTAAKRLAVSKGRDPLTLSTQIEDSATANVHILLSLAEGYEPPNAMIVQRLHTKAPSLPLAYGFGDLVVERPVKLIARDPEQSLCDNYANLYHAYSGVLSKFTAQDGHCVSLYSGRQPIAQVDPDDGKIRLLPSQACIAPDEALAALEDAYRVSLKGNIKRNYLVPGVGCYSSLESACKHWSKQEITRLRNLGEAGGYIRSSVEVLVQHDICLARATSASDSESTRAIAYAPIKKGCAEDLSLNWVVSQDQGPPRYSMQVTEKALNEDETLVETRRFEHRFFSVPCKNQTPAD